VPPDVALHLERTWLRRVGVPAEYLDATVAPREGVGDGQGVAPESPTAAQTVERFLCNVQGWFERGGQLVLLGGVGVGKSCVLGMLAKRAYTHQVGTLYRTVAACCNLFHGDNGREIERLHTVPLLLLDDWGAEYDHSYHRPRLGEIIDERQSHKRCTAVTSNLTQEGLQEKYPDMERTWSRLFRGDRTVVLTIVGEDRRRPV